MKILKRTVMINKLRKSAKQTTVASFMNSLNYICQFISAIH